MTDFISDISKRVIGVGNVMEDAIPTPMAFRQTPIPVVGTVPTVPLGVNPLTGEKVRKTPIPM